MANKKFSQFTEQTDTANVQFVVGYNGSDNVRISPTNLAAAGGDITGVTAGDGLSGGGTSGAVSLALDLNELTAAAVDVANDSIAIIDAGSSNTSKKESIADLATAMAGTGVTATNGVFSVATGDITGVTAGNGLSGGGTSGGVTLALDLNELTAATIDVANDSIAIIDSDDSNASKKETIADLATAIAGSGITATNGVLSVAGGDITGVTAGTGLNGGGSSGAVTLNIDAAQTGITSLLATDIKIGEDDETKIDFETANEIHFYANNIEQVYLADNVFGPQSDSDVDLGTSGVKFKDVYADTIKAVKVPQTFIGFMDDNTSSTSVLAIPFDTMTETSLSAGNSAKYTIVAPYAGEITKVVMENINDGPSTSFTTELFYYKNGSSTASSGELTASSSSEGATIDWSPTSSNTFAAGDQIKIGFQKSASGKYWNGTSISLVISYTDYDI